MQIISEAVNQFRILHGLFINRQTETKSFVEGFETVPFKKGALSNYLHSRVAAAIF